MNLYAYYSGLVQNFVFDRHNQSYLPLILTISCTEFIFSFTLVLLIFISYVNKYKTKIRFDLCLRLTYVSILIFTLLLLSEIIQEMKITMRNVILFLNKLVAILNWSFCCKLNMKRKFVVLFPFLKLVQLNLIFPNNVHRFHIQCI